MKSSARTQAYPLAVSLVLVLAALLRFYRLAGQSLWADEGSSVALAHRGLVEIARRTAFDIHPPLYYWLLKGWIFLFGDGEIGLRSLSAVLGVGLVYLVSRLGARLFNRRVGLLAALIAAISPLQVYYAQEARMYMLLALLGGLTVAAALANLPPPAGRVGRVAAGLGYGLAVTAGLYTHYAYPVIVLAVNLAALPWLARRPGRAGRWLSLHLLPALLYLPWLPIAWRQLTTWPSERQALSLAEILSTISTTLLAGLSWPANFGSGAAVGLGLMLLFIVYDLGSTRHQEQGQGLAPGSSLNRLPGYRRRVTLILLWFLFPVILTTLIFSPAFLKFLVVAAPALALLAALVFDRLSGSAFRLAGSVLLVSLAGASAVSLYTYYTDPAYARDNYRGIVQFLRAVSSPGDAVILHAEGQQDVFNYYYSRLAPAAVPVYPLPRQRPLDKAATLAELQAIAGRAAEVYAVYWATRQADPAGLIEGWLDSSLVKATDQWYGHVRLVSYASPTALPRPVIIPANYRLGQHLRLVGYGLSTFQVTPGDILPVVFKWQTDTAPEPGKNYTVFVQVLDGSNHLVGQRDAPPRIPMTAWVAGQPVVDVHGIFIEPGTPPGRHRVIAGLYTSDTGQRLPVSPPGDERPAEAQPGQDFIELGWINISRPASPLPPEAFPMQVRLDAPLLDTCLVGYDLYKSGYRSAPATTLRPGDLLHVVAYWRRCQPAGTMADWLSIQVISGSGGVTPLSQTSSLAGVAYPLAEWQVGEIVRGQYDLFLSNLEPGTYRLALTVKAEQPASTPATITTKPFRVE